MSSHPSINIVVCSCNEADSLPALFESLISQTVGTDAFHVIFVDNASVDSTREVVEKYTNLLSLEYIFEANPGKSYALNTGYEHASSEYVVQLDADCKADEYWLENILKVIEEENPDVLGGPYFAYYDVGKPAWFKDEYNQMYLGSQRKILSQEFLNGANIAWRRDYVLTLGGYSPTLSIVDTGMVGGEDTELIVRARRRNPSLKVVYDPKILVYHLTKKKYMDVFGYINWYWGIGLRRLSIFHLEGSRVSLFFTLKNFIILFFTIFVRCCFGIAFRDKKKFPYWENYIVEKIAPVFYSLGLESSRLKDGFVSNE